MHETTRTAAPHHELLFMTIPLCAFRAVRSPCETRARAAEDARGRRDSSNHVDFRHPFAREKLHPSRCCAAKMRNMDPAILYVDDERPNLDLFRRSFDEEFRVLTAQDGPAALEMLRGGEHIGVLVSDQRMQPMSGIELLTRAETEWPTVTRVLLTAYSDRDLLLQAIQVGKVHDYVLKPWRTEDLGVRLRAARDRFDRQYRLARAELERDLLRDEVRAREPSGIVGLEGGLASIAAVLDRVARTDSTVMIRGESGTGKELVAREIHRRSLRAERPFVRVNCAAFSEGVLESELFGHEAGSFTGAKHTRAGRFEQAHLGTLFLDEIGDVSPAVQVRLLRVLQERELERVGGNRTVKVNIRVIAATHRDLEDMVRRGQFRQDLFFRLQVVPIEIPPLRSRPGDLEALARHFLAHFGSQLGKRLEMSPGALGALSKYDWPGNVRELRNVIERAAVLADGNVLLEPEDFSFDMAVPPAPESRSADANAPSIFDEIAAAEAERIKDALRKAAGSKARAARILGIPRTTLNDRLRKLEIT
jgi:DNA-binding NtrC family response regulator